MVSKFTTAKGVVFCCCLFCCYAFPLFGLSYNLRSSVNKFQFLRQDNGAFYNKSLARVRSKIGLRECEKFDISTDQAITSLSTFLLTSEKNSSKYMLAAGTKRGGLLCYKLHIDEEEQNTSLMGKGKEWLTFEVILNVKALSDISINQITPAVMKYKAYPIYSMRFFTLDHDPTSHYLATGGGDRILTIIKFCVDKIQREGMLGFHTGWVKDIVPIDNVLFSIGCNCIESWCIKEGIWKHLRKRKIESSTDGATLSSDLLCLCSGTCRDSGKPVLFSAGVDGRIQQWSNDVNRESPISSIRAHDGRITCMQYANIASMLLTAGYDGFVRCTSLMNVNDNITNMEGSAKLQINAESETGLRLTSMSILNEEENSIIAAIGSTNGFIRIIECTRNDNDEIFVTAVGECIEVCKQGKSIHSIESLGARKCGKLAIAAGHAGGLSVLTFHPK